MESNLKGSHSASGAQNLKSEITTLHGIHKQTSKSRQLTTIFKLLKKKLDKHKCVWVEEHLEVLWAIERTSMGDTLFKLLSRRR